MPQIIKKSFLAPIHYQGQPIYSRPIIRKGAGLIDPPPSPIYPIPRKFVVDLAELIVHGMHSS